MKTECKNCKGKGHVLDAAGLFIPIIGWALMALETNSPDGITRDKCSHCNGTGNFKHHKNRN